MDQYPGGAAPSKGAAAGVTNGAAGAAAAANGKHSGHDAHAAKPPHGYGADVTRRQYFQLITALCMGTLIEWYDFTIYSQLSDVLTAAFFPAKDPVTRQLSFWGVYAAGFVSRPVGSIVFGHIGDSHGRRITMLLAIAAISIPSILIGCLPTFAQAGLVAPVLMAVLRIIQGLAVGGEFGSAITYLFELAPHHRKGVTASLGQASIAPGIGLGILVVQVILYACSSEELALWGWRVPFLLTVFTAPIAMLLRMHMPEPREYLMSRQQMVLRRVTSTAADRVARSYSRRGSSAGGAPSPGPGALSPALSGRRLSSRQLSVQLQELQPLPEEAPAGRAAADVESGAAGAAPAAEGGGADGAGAAGGPGFYRQLSAALQRSAASGAPLGCEAEYEGEVAALSATIKHHVPLVVLFRDHWRGVLLQVLLEAVYGSSFYIFFSWIPPYLLNGAGIPMRVTLWSVLIAMVLFAASTVLTGHFVCDRPVPKVWAYCGLVALITGLSFPALLWLHTGSMAALFVALPLMIALCGTLGGLMTSIGPQIYPAAVRASGYNLGHNLSMTIFGGFSPFAVTALSVPVHPPALAAAVVVAILAAVSIAAAAPLVRVAPRINARAAAGAGMLIG
ncbi:MAG: major facilitator superfamily domain-containing protein [Monoraphidium minutum]|nr:MAG: major facilitator superfamily domain-containing protein [Monoraphidium minutum]